MAPLAVEVDGLRIGIRAQDERQQRWLRELLQDFVVDDPGVVPNYSVRVSDDPGALHLLYWGGCLVARCRTEPELIDAIAAQLGGHGVPETGTVRLDGVALRNQSDAVVLTHVDYPYAVKIAGRLRRHAVTVEHRPWLDVREGVLLRASRLDLPGQSAPLPRATVRALLVPETVAEAEPLDRVLLMTRCRALQVTAGALSEAMQMMTGPSTESVQSYAVDRVAERVRALVVNQP